MRNNDELVKIRHYKKMIAQAERRGNDPQLQRGPGHTRKGSIFDCDRKSFEKALTNYWDRLYVGWNPYKNEGNGCWEVWQKPIKKEDTSDFEHWVADLPYLTLAFIKRLKEMDAWENKNIVKDIDDKYEDEQLKLTKEEEDNIRYVVRHNKSLFKRLKVLAQDGYNPLWFFSDKRQGDGQV